VSQRGDARWILRDHAITDYTTYENVIAAFSGPGGTATQAPIPPKPGKVSFDVRWAGVKRRYRVDNPAQQLRGAFVEPASATITWSGSTNGYSFVSKPGSVVAFAQVGEERNGIFF
jgi:hypothetical protein